MAGKAGLLEIQGRELITHQLLPERKLPEVHLPTLKDIERAQERIKGVAARTPLVESPALSKRFNRTVFLKLECFQPIRVFKIRGAYNKISQVKSKRVVAVSSGNHGIAVAYCSRLFGKTCTVIVPENAVQEKLDTIREFGAEVLKFGKYHNEREAKAQEFVKDGATMVHPFNDPEIMAGQGTAGIEIVEQLEEFDSVVVPVGGGGLISGIAIAVKSRRPKAKVFGVEPAGAAKLHASREAGRMISLEAPKSIADGLIPPSLGDNTFAATQRYVDGSYVVSDDEIISAMRIIAREAHIFPEPSGAASTAVLLANRGVEMLGERVVLVVSGGNVSLNLLKEVLSP